MRRLIGVVFVLLVLLVALDRVAWWTARRVVAERVRSEAGLAARPDVAVHGFPLLTQAVRGTYDRVDVTADDLSVQDGLTIDTLDVRMRGIHAGLGDLLHHRVSEVPVDSAVADATVGFAAIDAAVAQTLPDDGLQVTFAQGSGGLLAITGTYKNGLVSTQIHGQAEVGIDDGELELEVTGASLADIPEPLRTLVRTLLDRSYHLPKLPFGFTAKDVSVGQDGVTVRATATQVHLS